MAFVNRLKSAFRRTAGGADVPQADRTVAIRRVGDEIEATYQVAYNNVRPLHRPVYRTLKVPAGFYEERRHLLEATPRVTNHDLVSFWLFAQLLDRIPQDTVTVVEFGLWQGAFLENLALRAEHTGKKLVLYGFDNFVRYPDIAEAIDLRSRPRSDYERAISAHPPASPADIRRRLAQYPSVVDVKLVAGDITQLTPEPGRFDFVHFDMDFHAAFQAAMAWVANPVDTVLVVDDYYQPSWPGIVDAVNEFSRKHHVYPVNLSDYFRIERSLRTQWINILLPMRTEA